MKTFILAGGSGTRLFPLSRTRYPKQFIPLFKNESLFQKTVQRALLFSSPGEVYVITNTAHRFLVADQLAAIDAGCRVLVEPEGKNTLPAIVYGMTALDGEEDATVAVLPSDQLVAPDDEYEAAFRAAEGIAKDHLVTFGITPTSPHTGYGYIRPGKDLNGGYAVEAFVEKPDRKTAEGYVRDGYFWNSGMFLFSSALFMDECRRLAPGVAEAFTRHSTEEAYDLTPKVSVDYGVMEKTDRAAVVPLVAPWSDVGSFDALYQVSEKDEHGNAVKAEYLGIKSRNNLVISDRFVASIGLSDLAIVDTADALLVCPKVEAQHVGAVTALLKERGDERCDLHTTVHRPWGSYTVLLRGDSFQIKRLTLLPGRRISSQFHHHRSEHWVVVRGMARVSNDGKSFFVRPGESTFVPAGVRHRLENPGLIPLEVIEVQNGEVITEEDIVRFEDDFERG